MLLDSYHSARETRLVRWRYRMLVVEVAATYKEGEALFGETESEAEDNAGSAESLLCWHRRGPALQRPRRANNEAEDTASSVDTPPRRH